MRVYFHFCAKLQSLGQSVAHGVAQGVGAAIGARMVNGAHVPQSDGTKVQWELSFCLRPYRWFHLIACCSTQVALPVKTVEVVCN